MLFRSFQISEGVANIIHKSSNDFEKALKEKHKIGMWYPRGYNEMHMLTAAINKAKSFEPKAIAAALEGMDFDVFNGGPGTMRKDDHQFFQPIYISSFGERNDKEPFDEESTGWGWRIVATVDTKDTSLPTTCKRARPS